MVFCIEMEVNFLSTFNEIEMTTPYGDTDNVLELNIDSSSDAYVLQDVIKLPSTYTFSIWYRTENKSQITFNILGEAEIVDSTTIWKKYVKTINVKTLDDASIYIIPSVGVNSYLYEGYLSEGITDTSWLPAPEDIEGEIGSVRSELRQTADSILLKVSDSNGRITTLETNLEGITTEISDAKGSSTTLKARLEGIDTSVVNAETSAKSFATQEAERIQSVVQNNIDTVESNITQRADNIELSVAQKENVPVTAVRYIRDWLNGGTVPDRNIMDLRKYLNVGQKNKGMTIASLAYNSVYINCENCSAYSYFSIDITNLVTIGKTYNISFNATGTSTHIGIDEATDSAFSNRTNLNASSITIQDGYYYRFKIYGNASSTAQTTTYDNVYTNVQLVEVGSSSAENRWVECNVISGDINLALGITPTCKNSSLTALTVSNPEYYTDGMLLDEALERYISSTENSCLEIDLGDVYYNIDYIRVWHYYEDNRVYNHKMQISTDGVSWVTIYDSDITGGYAETSYGKVYYLNNAAVAENIALLNISANQIESRIENIEGGYSSIKEQADKIESIVGSESEDGATGLISSINNLDNLIAKLRSEYEKYKSDSGTSISTLTQTMNEITSRIATVEGNTRDISEIRQDAKGWQALFAQLDMYDMPEITTNISIDINGITITNPTTRQQTKITIDEFSGWYNNEKIFWIDKDTTKTRRLLCEKGWDTGTDFIKMTTNSYTYSDGRTLNGVAYIKSGGSS